MLKFHNLLTRVGVSSLTLLGTFTLLGSQEFGLSNNTFVSLSSSDGLIANAAEVKQYVPPADRARPQRTEGSGSRGCTNSIPVSLKLLTPNDHIARTVSARPTFFWYLSDTTNVPMVFSLVEPGKSEPIFQQQLKADKAGIIKVELPPNVPELAVGREYRWTVALVCSEKRPSENIYARAWIERIAISSELSQKLGTADSDRDRALIYARSGIWQDAVATLYKAHTANPGETQVLNSLNTLLAQVGITPYLPTSEP